MSEIIGVYATGKLTSENITGDKKMDENWDKVFMTKVMEIMSKRDLTIEAAADKVRVEHPAIHKAYMKQLLSLSGLEYK